jgi:hypothetical protein
LQKILRKRPFAGALPASLGQKRANRCTPIRFSGPRAVSSRGAGCFANPRFGAARLAATAGFFFEDLPDARGMTSLSLSVVLLDAQDRGEHGETIRFKWRCRFAPAMAT